MSSEMNDGGPAFPGFSHTDGRGSVKATERGEWENYVPGMTLRDYFAAKALPPIMETIATLTPSQIIAWAAQMETATKEETIAKLAYLIADAMLRERMTH